MFTHQDSLSFAFYSRSFTSPSLFLSFINTHLPPALSRSLSFSLPLSLSLSLFPHTFPSATQDGGSLIHPAAERSLFSSPGERTFPGDGQPREPAAGG